jgi:hypothetical protein
MVGILEMSEGVTVHNKVYVPLWGFSVIRSLSFKIRSVTVDSDGVGRQNHSLRSFILAPIPTTSHTRTLAAIVKTTDKLTYILTSDER